MARIDPSRRGGMDGRREKLGVLRKTSKISEKSKKHRKTSISRISRIFLLLDPSLLSADAGLYI